MGREAKAAEARRAIEVDTNIASAIGLKWAESAMQAIAEDAAQPLVTAIDTWRERSIGTLIGAFGFVYNRAAWISIRSPNTNSIQLVRELAAAIPIVVASLDDAKKGGHATAHAGITEGARRVLSNLYGQVSDALTVANASRSALARQVKAAE